MQRHAERTARRAAARKGGAAQRRPGASFVLRIEPQPDGRCRYLLHDLRNGELRLFRQRAHLQRWLRGAVRGRLG